MKKAISILLLLPFLYSIIGYYVAFKIIQLDIRNKAKEQIEKSLNDDQLEVIVVPVAKGAEMIKWMREGKEFEYDKKMYDIVRKKTEGDETYYYCLNDRQEERLFANLDNIVRKNTSQNEAVKNIFSKVLDNYYYEKVIIGKSVISHQYIFINVCEHYKELVQETHTPPPKFS